MAINIQPSSDDAAGPWAIRLPTEQAAAAGALRLRPGVLACDAADGLWLRGERLTAELDLAIRTLPGAERYSVGHGGAVTPVGRRVPTGVLPAGDWQPVDGRFRPAARPALLAGRLATRAPLRLVRSGRERAANVLVLPLAAWANWAVDAPQVRLRPLAFAASPDGRVVVRGLPLPPVAGARYVERGGVAVPAGLDWEPAVDAATVRALLGTGPGDLALFAADGTWQRIAAGHFVAASRAAARATVAALSEMTARDDAPRMPR